MNTPPLGYTSAAKVLRHGRVEFFQSPVTDLPVAESVQIGADDRLPQFGYVGSNYLQHRVLLLGINPGNGPRRCRSPEDEIVMPALATFVTEQTPEAFAEAQRAYKSVCQGWAVWGRQCNELLVAAGLGPEDVAFSNALPWRTNSKSAFSPFVAAQAAALYVQPVVDELAPRIIVALGKKAGQMLTIAQRMTDTVVVWNRAQALQPSVIAEREFAARKFAKLVEASV